MTERDIKRYLISGERTAREAVSLIGETRDGIALVVDDDGRLIGTITDGDVRRALLAGRSLDAPCHEILWPSPTTAPVGTSSRDLQELMMRLRLQNIPLVSEDNRPRGVVNLRDLLASPGGELTAVVMAGGEGKRLRPITESIPKPMVEVGGRPILESILEQLAQAGVERFFLAVNYRSEVIEERFGNGSALGLKIEYLREERKMGTAGALGLLPEIPAGPLLVVHGDVVTRVEFDHLLSFHHQHRSAMTIAACEYHIRVPFGVLELADEYVMGVQEKPEYRYLCNAGIYCIDSDVLHLVPDREELYHMTDLIGDVRRAGLPVTAFPMHEYWIDVGQKEDLMRAREDSRENGAGSDG